jgi:U3 small nucleolar RNA-associated protein 11
VLKTQDENYIRTMRLAGLKVRLSYHRNLLLLSLICAVLQKIDRLKEQLMSLVNLLKQASSEVGTPDLDSNEVEILVEAGVLPSKPKRIKKPGHIVFVDKLQDGK